MKFVANRVDLSEELNFALKAIPSKATLPSSSCVHITASTDGTVTLKTTNLDITLTAKCQANEVEPGAVCVGAKRLAQILHGMADDVVSIEADLKNEVQIKGASCGFKLLGLPDDDFPTQPEDEVETVEICGPALEAVLVPVLHAVSEDETRFILCGVNFTIGENGELLAVATDGRRLAMCGVDPTKVAKSGTVPTQTARLLALMAHDADKVELGLASSFVVAESATRSMRSKLIEGSYPNWKQVLPKDQPHLIKFDPSALSDALKRVSVIGAETVVLTMGKGRLTVSGSVPEVGSAAESVALPAWTSKTAEKISLAPNYLLDALAHCEDTGELGMTDESSPLTVCGENYKAVIMPKRMS